MMGNERPELSRAFSNQFEAVSKCIVIGARGARTEASEALPMLLAATTEFDNDTEQR